MRPIDADSVLRQMMRGYELMMDQMADRSAEVRGAMEDARLIFTYAVYDAPTIDVAPAVEAEPVRHGRWEKGGYACGETEWKCSVCGETEWRTSCSRMKFCMFCGAEMDAGQEDTDMAKIPMNDSFAIDKFDPYKDTLVTTVRGTAEEVQEVLDKLMGDETNKIERNTVSLRQKWISVKERMPSKGEKVLLYIPEREGCKQHGMYLGAAGEVEADPKGEHNFWGRPTPGSNWIIDGWSFFEEPIVTHWMPMPDAPEVDDE